MSTCPPIETINSLLDGTLDDATCDNLEAHLDTCSDCLQRLQGATPRGWDTWQNLIDTREPATLSAEQRRTTESPAIPDDTFPDVDGFELLEEIGRGGMGVVYRARDLALNRTVALKMLLAGALSGPERIQRFRIEAEAVARLQHPGIVQIHSVGEHKGLPFLVLEYVSGRDLRQWTEQAADNRLAASIVRSAAQAIQYAHDQQVVHRDLKPENILLPADDGPSQFGEPKVTDFGLAWHVEADVGTRSSVIMGTPCYMAPEQATGGRGLEQTSVDVYGLGAVLYFLLTGRPPHDGETAGQVLTKLLHDAPATPRSLRADTPVDLETITMKCLERSPSDRYAAAGDLADDLDRFLKHEPIRARPIGPVGRLIRWRRRRPVQSMLAATATVLAAAMVVVGVLYARESRVARRALDDRAEIEERAALLQDEADAGTYVAQIRAALRAWQVSDFPQMRAALDACLPEHRGWEWGFLRKRLDALGHPVPLHAARVTDLATSADGQLAASCSEDGTVAVFRVPDAEIVARWESSVGPLKCVLLSVEHGVLVVAGPEAVELFELESLLFNSNERGTRSLHPLEGEQVADGRLSESPDGSESVSPSRPLLWRRGEEPDSGTPEQLPPVITGFEGQVTGIALHPDGRRLAACTDRRHIAVCDLVDGTLTQAHRPQSQEFTGIAFDTSGSEILCTTSSGWLVRFDADSLEQLQRVKLAGTTGRGIFSRDRTRVVTLHGTQPAFGVDELDLTKEDRRHFYGRNFHLSSIVDGAVHPDAERVVLCSPDRLSISAPRQNKRGEGLLHLVQIGDFQAELTGVDFAGDGHVIVGTESGAIRILSVAVLQAHDFRKQATRSATLPCQRATLAIDPPGRMVAVAPTNSLTDDKGPYSIELRDAESLELIARLPRQSTVVCRMEFTSDGAELYALHEDGRLRVYDVRALTVAREWGVQDPPMRHRAMDMSPDGRLIATGGTDVRVWNAEGGRRVDGFTGHPHDWNNRSNAVNNVWFSPDSRHLISNSYGRICVHDVDSGELNYHIDSTSVMQYSSSQLDPNTGLLVATVDSQDRLYELSTGRLLHSRDGIKGRFTPFGRILTRESHDTASDTGPVMVRLFDSETAGAVFEWPGELFNTNWVRFSPDYLSMFITFNDGILVRMDAAEWRSAAGSRTGVDR